ncbi:hypothetical protein [Luteolibacter marinus]|uniref:hypothetical protein n=1 Tax=Luteolibacter marinus TaxID=2776705 RepID=UPI001867B545|nr:hypothetical protein [Luteolibacter marinus]
MLLLVLLNLILATPWPRKWIAGKISARTGLEATVGRASWTPWGGAAIGNLEIRQPAALQELVKQPLLKVAGIQVFPDWSQAFQGRPAVSRIRVESPELVVSLEMLVSLVASSSKEAGDIPSPPEVAVTSIDPPAKRSRGSRSLPDDAPVEKSLPVPDRTTLDPSNTWLEVVDGRFELHLAGAKVLGAMGVSGNIPVTGTPAASSILIGEVHALGRSLQSDLMLPLAWKAPEIRCEVSELPFAGLRLQVSAAAGLVRGAPFGVVVSLPGQAADGEPFFKTLRPVATRVEARFGVRGLLRYPSTWEGGGDLSARGIRAVISGGEIDFDNARVQVQLKSSLLQCPEARLTGDRVSLLGNGQVGAGGEAAAVLRVVMPPSMADGWKARFAGTGMTPAFVPLGGGERQYIDLRWISYSGGQGIELGSNGPVIPAGEARQLLLPGAMN